MNRLVMPGSLAVLWAALAVGQTVPPSLTSQHALVDQYCSACHNDKLQSGGINLGRLDLAHPDKNADLAEKAIRKLRAGLMPPAGLPRPDQGGLNRFVTALETQIDQAAVSHPNA